MLIFREIVAYLFKKNCLVKKYQPWRKIHIFTINHKFCRFLVKYCIYGGENQKQQYLICYLFSILFTKLAFSFIEIFLWDNFVDKLLLKTILKSINERRLFAFTNIFLARYFLPYNCKNVVWISINFIFVCKFFFLWNCPLTTKVIFCYQTFIFPAAKRFLLQNLVLSAIKFYFLCYKICFKTAWVSVIPALYIKAINQTTLDATVVLWLLTIFLRKKEM